MPNGFISFCASFSWQHCTIIYIYPLYMGIIKLEELDGCIGSIFRHCVMEQRHDFLKARHSYDFNSYYCFESYIMKVVYLRGFSYWDTWSMSCRCCCVYIYVLCFELPPNLNSKEFQVFYRFVFIETWMPNDSF
jgi:hypothetical protein